MGLDIVELVIQVEERFGVSFSDEEASGLITVGDMYSPVLKHLKLDAPERLDLETGFVRLQPQLLGQSWTAQDVWQTLRSIVIDQLQVDPREVVPSARINQDLGAD